MKKWLLAAIGLLAFHAEPAKAQLAFPISGGPSGVVNCFVSPFAPLSFTSAGSFISPPCQNVGTTYGTSKMYLFGGFGDNGGSYELSFVAAAGTPFSPAIMADNSEIFYLNAMPFDGTTYNYAGGFGCNLGHVAGLGATSTICSIDATDEAGNYYSLVVDGSTQTLRLSGSINVDFELNGGTKAQINGGEVDFIQYVTGAPTSHYQHLFNYGVYTLNGNSTQDILGLISEQGVDPATFSLSSSYHTSGLYGHGYGAGSSTSGHIYFTAGVIGMADNEGLNSQDNAADFLAHAPASPSAGGSLTNHYGFYEEQGCTPGIQATNCYGAYWAHNIGIGILSPAYSIDDQLGDINVKSGQTYRINGTPLISVATTGSIGGGALAAGACASGTVAVTGATTGMVVDTTPVTYPGDAVYWKGYVSSTGTVTVKVCVAIAATPTASAYNVRVLQ